MNIINGKFVSTELKKNLKIQVEQFVASYGRAPCLAVIIVGDDPASTIYVRNKHKACLEVGMNSMQIELPKETTQMEIINIINNLNNDTEVDGILVQLPLPKHIDEQTVINTINPNKDVDAFHPINVGKILIGNYDFLPCTPAGIIELFDAYGIDITGKRALVIGRSNIVGKPMSLLLTERNATVTLAHSKTHRDLLLRLFATSDIVIVAVGKPNFITENDAWQYLKDYRHDFYRDFNVIQNRIIIDVGINRDANGKLCGDLPEEFKQKYSLMYTPVPGGVGPMTIAILLKNTLTAAKLLKGQSL
jgi:methylenetetrahydrofolate dehydrogenase (NADP+)/methenyltetrahydrofolate cyclohydrolase